MSFESVCADLALRAPHLAVHRADEPTPTVATAAAVHGVAPGQIAKTLAFWVGSGQARFAVLVVASGQVRIDAKKFKAYFQAKGKMLQADEVVALTSHPVGGVCPFGLPTALPIYLDQSLQVYSEVLPAAGCIHSMVRVSLSDLEALTAGQWVDFAQMDEAS